MTRRVETPLRRARPVSTGLVLAAGTLVLASCATPGASGTDASNGPAVVATTTQIGDFTIELLGDTAEVTQLLSPGQSAHGFDPSAAQLLALADADALVVNGGGLESWLDDAVSASGFDGVLIDASTDIELFGTGDHADHDDGAQTDDNAANEHDHADAATDGAGDDADDATAEHGDNADAATDGHATDGHATDGHATDGHAADADDHAGHDHGDGNPHIWTDPALAERMVHNIAHGLETVPGIDSDAVAANEDAYLARLDALDAWIEQNVETVPAEQRLLVTNHDAFTYFVDAYDITFVGSVIPSFDDNAEPSAAEIDDLVAKIRETGVQAVFSEASISPKAAETIAREAGVAVYSGEDALYGDSLGPPGSDGETYLGSQEHNARLILESWGIEPSPLPALLQG